MLSEISRLLECFSQDQSKRARLHVVSLQVPRFTIPKEAPGQGLARDLLFREFVGKSPRASSVDGFLCASAVPLRRVKAR